MPDFLPIYARRVGNALAAAFLFITIALVYNGLVLDVDYNWRRVISVAQVPGRDMSRRQVVIDLGGGLQRRLTTQEVLVVVRPGQKACIGRRQVLFRSYEIHSLELPGYCRAAILPEMPSGEPALVAAPDVSE